jgi:SulP family sulfate permease
MNQGKPAAGAKTKEGPAREAAGAWRRLLSSFLLPLSPLSFSGLRADLVAGLTVAAVAVPQAMAYALIAGIDPRYGLYTAIVMTALGSLFGSSAHLINGPTNAISLVVFSAVAGISAHGPVDARAEAVFLLSLLVGGLQLLIYFLRLGDLTRFVSESVALGFMLGAGFLVALSQVPNLLGLHAGAGPARQHLLERLYRTLEAGGPVQAHAVALGLGTVALVLALRALGDRLRLPLPDMLLALVLASLAAWLTGWQESWRDFPARLPAFHVPRADLDRVRELAGSALAIALLGLLEALTIAKSIAARTRQPLDYNRQCLGEGLANLGGGLFQCMPGSGSLTRSAINFQAGAVSRLSGVLSALTVAAGVLLLAGYARYVPRPALAGLLLVTAWRLVDRRRIAYCLRATRSDACILLATAAAAVFVSIEFSILIGVFLSFVFFVPRAARLRASELVVSRERVVRERQPDDPPCGRLVLFSLEGELFFGAAPELEQHLADLRARAEAGARAIVLRLKRTRNPDMACLERLQLFLEDMQRRKVPVLLCGVREDFAQALHRLRFHHWLPQDHVFLEEAPAGNGDGPALSSTLKAVRRAYELLGDESCANCPRRQETEPDRGGWYYMI